MKENNYRQLFKELIKSYYEDVFEDKVNEIMDKKEINKVEFSRIVSASCGVDVDYSDDFSSNLIRAIENYKKSKKVVLNTNSCTKNCIDIDGKTICQNACPFDAIILDSETLLPKINIETCVDCGKCVDVCDNYNYIDKIEFIPLLKILKDNNKVIAAVAPSIAGQFGDEVSMGQMRAALKCMGFVDMVEVAFFADMLTIKETIEFNRLINAEKDFMLSSCCCPIWVAMIKGKYKELIKYTSPSVSPMIAAGKIFKEIDPECKVVFIGPCIAKKAEARQEDLKDAIDFVLTFAELKDIFDVLNIRPEKLHEELSTQYTSKGGRIYGRIGGVTKAVKEGVNSLFPDKAHYFTSEQASGVSECMKLLEKNLIGNTSARFLEGMGCDGGCVGGPKAIISKEKGKIAVDNYGEESKVKISLDNKIMNEFLSAINIQSIDDFKNIDKIKIFERKLE